MGRAAVWGGWAVVAANSGAALAILVVLVCETSYSLNGVLAAGWVGGPFAALGVLAARARPSPVAVLLTAAATVGAGWLAVAVIGPDLFSSRSPTSGLSTLIVPVGLWTIALLTWVAVATEEMVRRWAGRPGTRVEPGAASDSAGEEACDA